MSIKNQFDKAKANILLEVDNNVEKIALDLLSKIQLKSPVDSGDLKIKWSIAKESDRHYVITSGVPYAYILEYGLYPNPPKEGKGLTEGGYSKKAPQGFVRISVKEVSNEWK